MTFADKVKELEELWDAQILVGRHRGRNMFGPAMFWTVYVLDGSTLRHLGDHYDSPRRALLDALDTTRRLGTKVSARNRLRELRVQEQAKEMSNSE